MITVRNNIKLAALLTIGCIILSGFGENIYLAIFQVVLYIIIAYLIVKE
jgi:hypothetical protein|tara:strand:- start:297 stop:443 length:147 start_codon:yes stop_codon:yes gene_type:complete